MHVELTWVKSHKGILGNEIADRAAKTGAKLPPSARIECSKTAVKEEVNKHTYKVWNDRWANQTSCRQTKLFIPHIDRAKSKEIMKLNKHDMGILVRNVTGHTHMDRHKKILGEIAILSDSITEEYLNHINGIEEPPRPKNSPKKNTLFDEVDPNMAEHFGTCKLCLIKGSEETPYHLAMECPYTWRGRGDFLKSLIPGYSTLMEWEPDKLVAFFKRYNLEEDN